MSRIVLEKINKYYGRNHVLKDIDLTIEDGDFLTLLGPSGCGKTTMLRVIAGLEKPEVGRMTIDGNPVIDAETALYLEPSKRGLNIVFQSYALWPHMTVFENVAFGLKLKKQSKSKVEKGVFQALENMRISQYHDRYPSELSGGQQQRVAIARAIASNPGILLLDEPLSNLDARLRIDMRAELKRLHRNSGTTIIYVTHDQVEALTMSTRIALFKQGEISQIDTPLNLYMNPTNLESADFIGNPRINLIRAMGFIGDDGLTVNCDLGTFKFDNEYITGKESVSAGEEFECRLGLRPETVEISQAGIEGKHTTKATVYASQPAGSETFVTLTVGNSEFLALQMGLIEYSINQPVHIRIRPEKMTVYDFKTGLLIKNARF